MRRLTTLIIYIRNLGNRQATDVFEFTGVLLITSGAVFAGASDLTADYFGFILVILSDIFTASFFIVSNENKEILSPLEQTYYVALYAWPISYLLSYCNEEFINISSTSYMFTGRFV